MADILEINDIHELSAYRLAWDSLFPKTPGASFFHTLDWLTAYWKHFGSNQKLRALILRSCGKPLGIVPLCVRRMRYRVGNLRVLTYPLDDWGVWYGPIGPNQAVSMVLAMQHVRRTPRDWDMIDLRWVGPTASDGGRPGRAMRIAGLEPRKSMYLKTSMVDVAGGWESYLARKSSRHRGEIRRILRRVNDRSDVTFVRHRPLPARDGGGDPRWDLYELCEQVAARSWQARATNGNTMTHERVRGFLREAHEHAAHAGMVDMNVLLVAGCPAAFTYNYVYDGRVVGLRTGFHRTEQNLGAGSGLIIRSVRDSCARGDHSIDLGGGNWSFKRRLQTHTQQSYQLTHMPLSSWRSQAVRFTRWIKERQVQPEPDHGKSTSA